MLSHVFHNALNSNCLVYKKEYVVAKLKQNTAEVGPIFDQERVVLVIKVTAQ